MIDEFIKELNERIEERKYKIKLKEKIVRNGLIIEEEKLGKYGNLLIYSRRDKIGEGFGNSIIGKRVSIIERYIYDDMEKDEFGRLNKGKIRVEGILVRITRRINSGYYDYWYKVKLDNGRYLWRSGIKKIE